MDAVVPEDHVTLAHRFREILATYEEVRDLITVGAYREGSDPRVDDAIAKYPKIMDLLKQSGKESRSMEQTRQRLSEIAAPSSTGASPGM